MADYHPNWRYRRPRSYLPIPIRGHNVLPGVLRQATSITSVASSPLCSSPPPEGAAQGSTVCVDMNIMVCFISANNHTKNPGPNTSYKNQNNKTIVHNFLINPWCWSYSSSLPAYPPGKQAIISVRYFKIVRFQWNVFTLINLEISVERIYIESII